MILFLLERAAVIMRVIFQGSIVPIQADEYTAVEGRRDESHSKNVPVRDRICVFLKTACDWSLRYHPSRKVHENLI